MGGEKRFSSNDFRAAATLVGSYQSVDNAVVIIRFRLQTVGGQRMSCLSAIVVIYLCDRIEKHFFLSLFSPFPLCSLTRSPEIIYRRLFIVLSPPPLVSR